MFENNNNSHISSSDLAVQYGFSLFETFYIDKNGKIFLLDKHLERLINSMNFFNFHICFNETHIKSLIVDYIEKYTIRDKVMRITVTYGNKEKNLLPQIIINCRESNIIKNVNSKEASNSSNYSSDIHNECVKLDFCSFLRNDTSPIVNHKTSNYLENYLSKIEAQKKRVYDVLFINTKNNIAETSKCNIFFVINNVLFTPDVKSGILPGITRDWVIEKSKQLNLQIKIQPLDKTVIYNAQEVFITNSVIGILPVGCIYDKIYNVDEFIITNIIKSLYETK